MKRYRYIFIFLVFMSCGSIRPHTKEAHPDAQFARIFIGQGVGSLLINHSSKKEVDAFFGSGKEIDVVVSFADHSSTLNRVLYPDAGIEVEYSNFHKLKKTDTLKIIMLFDPCKLETPDGIKIGSSRLEVENILGEPSSAKYVKFNVGSVYHSVSYGGVEFEFNDTTYNPNTMMNSTVNKITIW